MLDVMVDLETTGMRPGCAILSIGAVAFDTTTGKLGPEMYDVVNLRSCEVAGLTTQKSTMDWWEKQSAGARKVLDHAKGKENLGIHYALEKLNAFLYRFDRSRVRVWGNGSDFDNAILASCYGATGVEPGWKYWNNRCYRTLKNLRPKLLMVKEGTAHNALDDAKQQAKHALTLLDRMQVEEITVAEEKKEA